MARPLGIGMLLLAVLGAAGCAASGGGGGAADECPPGAGRLVWAPAGSDDAGRDPARARCVAGRAGAADVVHLGEAHDNPRHHAIQRAILEALLAAGSRPALAFEMLTEDQQGAVDAALAGPGAPADVERALAWRRRGWPDFAMYWPLLELARRHRLAVVAADLAPDRLRAVARAGLAAQGAAAPGLGSLLAPDAAREARLADTIRHAHCDMLPPARLPAMLEAWHARNVTMARRVDAALARAPQVVVIAGRGHQDEGGMPDQLARLRPGVRQLVVGLGEVGGGGDAGREDVVWLVPPVARPDPCEEFGRRQRAGSASTAEMRR